MRDPATMTDAEIADELEALMYAWNLPDADHVAIMEREEELEAEQLERVLGEADCG